MARIRTIKPEFPQSESMGRVSRDARLCFVLLWTISDDAGNLRGNSRMLASLLFPYDNDAPELLDGWLDELEAQDCIIRYVHENNNYIQIQNWLSHQRVDKPSPSKIPKFVEGSRKFARVPVRTKDQGPIDSGPRTKDHKTLGAKLENSATDKSNGAFERFWKVYPSRGKAANPEKPARQKFDAAVKHGADPEKIIAAAEAYRRTANQEQTKPQYIAQAITWLNQERWKDQPPAPAPTRTPPGSANTGFL